MDVGEKWADENGVEYVVTDKKGTVIISKSVEPIIDEEEN